MEEIHDSSDIDSQEEEHVLYSLEQERLDETLVQLNYENATISYEG